MIDKVFVAAAFIQTVLTTIRAGSRAVHMFRTGGIGVMDGPLILPPLRRNESAFVWELSAALRHAVRLEARPDLYSTEYVETSLLDPKEGDDDVLSSSSSERTSDAYRMSTYGVNRQQAEDEKLDGWIDDLLLEGRDESLSVANASRTSLEDYNDRDYLDTFQETTASSSSSSSPPPVVEEAPNEEDDNDDKDDPNAQVAEIESEIIAELSQIKDDSTGFFSHINQRLSSVGKSIQKNVAKRWQRIEGNLDEMSEEEIDEQVASATSFIAQVDIASEMSTPKTAFVYAYAPEIFRDLRRFFGVKESQYLHSVLESGPFVSFQSNSKGAARVGGVFFFTRDGAYLIKTIKRDEVGAFLHVLTRYYNFMKRNGRRSLLTRFCGMYEIQLPVSGTKTRRETFVVMNSVFPVEAAKFISERFDLKGSTMGRECSVEEKLSKGSNAILKDLDLAKEVELLRSLRRRHGPKDVPVGLHIGPTAKAALLAQLRRDVQLLVDCKLIDYSLLVGVVMQSPTGPSMQDLVVASFSDGMDTEFFQEPSQRCSPLDGLLKPARTLLTPPAFLAKTVAVSIKRAAAWPLPYYGSELCGVEAGSLSHIKGERMGREALFYFGLIDFLQPFNWKKELEFKWKSMRYGEGFSCVPPQLYGKRFLDFIDRHVT